MVSGAGIILATAAVNAFGLLFVLLSPHRIHSVRIVILSWILCAILTNASLSAHMRLHIFLSGVGLGLLGEAAFHWRAASPQRDTHLLLEKATNVSEANPLRVRSIASSHNSYLAPRSRNGATRSQRAAIYPGRYRGRSAIMLVSGWDSFSA